MPRESSFQPVDLRKVQLTGGSSLTVTLPKEWTDKVGLKAGDVVACSAQPDGTLVVNPHARGDRAVQRYVISYEGEDPAYLFRKVLAAYITGYDTVVVKAHAPLTTKARQAVRESVRRIMGFEIVEEDPSAITLQDFLDPREFHMEKALRRMGLLTQAMQQEALGALREPRADALQSAEDRDDEVDRLFWLVNKQYHALLRDATYAAKMGLTAGQALNVLLVARLVERTADHADRIAAETLLLPREKRADPFLQRLEAEGRKAVDLFQASLQAFLKKDAKAAHEAIEEAARFQDRSRKLLADSLKLGPESVSHLALIVESIGRTAAYAADVGEVAINHRVATPEEREPVARAG